jgi:DNA polymerase V
MPRGGKREGSGRPFGQGKFAGKPSKVIRIPEFLLPQVQALLGNAKHLHHLPLYSSKVQAGFPSPADDYIERYLDLNSECIKHPSSTFMVRATGDSMVDAGIFSGDLLIVDRSLEVTDGKIVIAAINGELTVKRIAYHNSRLRLMPANPNFSPIDITDEQELVIWGVVTYVLHEPK